MAIQVRHLSSWLLLILALAAALLAGLVAAQWVMSHSNLTHTLITGVGGDSGGGGRIRSADSVGSDSGGGH